MDTIAESFARFIALSLIIVGVSHVVQAAWWSRIMTGIVARPDGALVLAMMALPLGLAGVAVHNRWGWSAHVIVTLVSWAWAIKGTLYLLFPRLPARVARGKVERPANFIAAGLGSV